MSKYRIKQMASHCFYIQRFEVRDGLFWWLGQEPIEEWVTLMERVLFEKSTPISHSFIFQAEQKIEHMLSEEKIDYPIIHE